jgi:hypothetical protein
LTSVPAGSLIGTINQANLGTSSFYTPTIGDGVNNFSAYSFYDSGSYVKMGNLVYFEVVIEWYSKGSANSGSVVQISLPPSLPVVSVYNANFTIGYTGGITFANQVTAYSANGLSYFVLSSISSGGTYQNLTVSAFGTGGFVSVSGFYRWQ